MSDLIRTENIAPMIHWFRGEKVILDRDLAQLYGVETRALKQAVRRNAERFPADFMFELSDEELAAWRSQSVMSNAELKDPLAPAPRPAAQFVTPPRDIRNRATSIRRAESAQLG